MVVVEGVQMEMADFDSKCLDTGSVIVSNCWPLLVVGKNLCFRASLTRWDDER